MTDAILCIETGFTPDQLENISESLLNQMMIYKGIKNVIQNGGELNL